MRCVATFVMSPKQAPVPSIDPRHARYRLKVAPSEIHRWGVYAEEFIPRQRKVIEYTGERISRRETKRRSDGR
jgi:Proteins containing SET domain